MSAKPRHCLPIALGLAFVLSVPGFAVAKEVELPMYVGGRAAPAKPEGKPLQQWPGIYTEARFSGERLTVQFNDDANNLLILIDGKPAGNVRKPGMTKIQISKIPAGEHTVRVEKRSESQDQAAGLTRFFVPKATNIMPAPTPLARQIEFIGDSYTVGYGNTSPKRECTTDEVWATTDTSQAFAPLTAKHYNADYQINAFSGRGIVRNYNGIPGDPLPGLYPYALFDGKTVYKDDGWKPQIIVIGLGTNDFSTPLNPGEKWQTREALRTDYRETYVRFVQSLRAKNPNAFIILMASDQHNGEIRDQVLAVTDTLKTSGETRLESLIFTDLDYGGCHAHPSVADDKKLQALLSGFIDARPNLWRGR